MVNSFLTPFRGLRPVKIPTSVGIKKDQRYSPYIKEEESLPLKQLLVFWKLPELFQAHSLALLFDPSECPLSHRPLCRL